MWPRITRFAILVLGIGQVALLVSRWRSRVARSAMDVDQIQEFELFI